MLRKLGTSARAAMFSILLVGAALLFAAVFAGPAAAQFFPGLGSSSNDNAEADADKALIDALQQTVGEGAEIIVIRPGGVSPEEPAGGEVSDGGWDYSAIGATDGKMVEMARSEIDKLFLTIYDRISRAE